LSEIFALSRDITDLVQAREAERLSNQKFMTAFQLSPFSVSIVRNLDGVIEEANETFLADMSAEADEIPGTRYADWVEWREPELRQKL